MWNSAGPKFLSRVTRIWYATFVVMFGAMFLSGTFDSSPAGAGEREIKRGKQIWSNKSTCNRCHGWAGDGRGHPRSPGDAPSLRISELDREEMRVVIACGVPGTAMPYHDRHAYKDDRCYGLTEDDLGDEMMPKLGQKPIRENEIEFVIDYIEARIKGKGKVTWEECEQYFKVGASRCTKLPRIADLAD